MCLGCGQTQVLIHMNIYLKLTCGITIYLSEACWAYQALLYFCNRDGQALKERSVLEILHWLEI